jgi:hypothetical protein
VAPAPGTLLRTRMKGGLNHVAQCPCALDFFTAPMIVVTHTSSRTQRQRRHDTVLDQIKRTEAIKPIPTRTSTLVAIEAKANLLIQPADQASHHTFQLCFVCQLLHHCVNASLLLYFSIDAVTVLRGALSILNKLAPDPALFHKTTASRQWQGKGARQLNQGTSCMSSLDCAL